MNNQNDSTEFLPTHAGDAPPKSNSFSKESAMIVLGALKQKLVLSMQDINFGNMQHFNRRFKSEVLMFIDFRSFSKPKSAAEAMARMKSNSVHFRLMYGAIYLLTLLYYVLAYPSLFVELTVIAGLWIFLFYVKDPNQVFKLGEHEIGKREKLLILVPLTTFIVVFGGVISYFLYIIFIGSLINGTHASFRDKVQLDVLEEMEFEQSQLSRDSSTPIGLV